MQASPDDRAHRETIPARYNHVTDLRFYSVLFEFNRKHGRSFTGEALIVAALIYQELDKLPRLTTINKTDLAQRIGRSATSVDRALACLVAVGLAKKVDSTNKGVLYRFFDPRVVAIEKSIDAYDPQRCFPFVEALDEETEQSFRVVGSVGTQTHGSVNGTVDSGNGNAAPYGSVNGTVAGNGAFPKDRQSSFLEKEEKEEEEDPPAPDDPSSCLSSLPSAVILSTGHDIYARIDDETLFVWYAMLLSLLKFERKLSKAQVDELIKSYRSAMDLREKLDDLYMTPKDLEPALAKHGVAWDASWRSGLARKTKHERYGKRPIGPGQRYDPNAQQPGIGEM